MCLDTTISKLNILAHTDFSVCVFAVTEILDTTGATVVKYTYDAKSSVLAQTDKQNWEGGNNWWRNIVYALFGVLGILKKWHA